MEEIEKKFIDLMLTALLFVCAVIIGIGTTLFLVFLILKLANVIAWSWLIVFSPLIAMAIAILVFILVNYFEE